MNKFPSNFSLVITGVLMIFILSLDFIKHAKENFFQLNYNWDYVSLLKEYKDDKIDSLSHEYLKIRVDSNYNFNTENTYCLNNTYYFNTTNIHTHDSFIEFTGLNWINNIPNSNVNLYSFDKVVLPIIQKGSYKVCMIGDSQISWLDGKYTRKNIHKELNDVTFVGSKKDVFGFPYEASILNSTEDILKNIDLLPEADSYILFIGAHEKKDNTVNNLKYITDFLCRKGNLIVVLPYFNNAHKNTLASSISNLFTEIKDNPNIKLIHLKDIVSDKDLLKDGIHLNLSGHNILTNQLVSLLKIQL